MEPHECVYEDEIKEIHAAIIGTVKEPGIRDMLRQIAERMVRVEASAKSHDDILHGNGGGSATGLCERLRLLERCHVTVSRVVWAGGGVLLTLIVTKVFHIFMTGGTS